MVIWNDKTNDQLEKISLQLGTLNRTIKKNNETDIDKKYDIERKMDIILELLYPNDKILIDENELTNLIRALFDYFNEIQKESLCKDKNTELPKGTHKILDKLEKFNETYSETLKEKKRNEICDVLSGRVGRTLN